MPDRRLVVRRHPSSRGRTAWQRCCSSIFERLLLILDAVFSRGSQTHFGIVIITRSVEAQHKRARFHSFYLQGANFGKGWKDGLQHFRNLFYRGYTCHDLNLYQQASGKNLPGIWLSRLARLEKWSCIVHHDSQCRWSWIALVQCWSAWRMLHNLVEAYFELAERLSGCHTSNSMMSLVRHLTLHTTIIYGN